MVNLSSTITPSLPLQVQSLDILQHYSLDIMRAGWKEKSVNKLHWYSYTYNHTSYEMSFG